MVEITKIAIFKGRKVRRVIYKNEWWFVVEDVVLALIDSNDPKQYVQRMKLRDPDECPHCHAVARFRVVDSRRRGGDGRVWF